MAIPSACSCWTTASVPGCFGTGWLQLSSVMCFASYCCGVLLIFALFPSSQSYCHHHLLSLDFRRGADDGKFVLQLRLQHSSVLPSLLVSTGFLKFVTGRGLGLILATLFVVIDFTFLALCMMPCNMFAFTSSTTRPPLLYTVISLRLTARTCSIGLLIRLDSLQSLPSRTSAVQL